MPDPCAMDANGRTGDMKMWAKRGCSTMNFNTKSAAVMELRAMEERYETHRFADGVGDIEDHLVKKPKAKKPRVVVLAGGAPRDPTAAARAVAAYEIETELQARINTLEAENKQLDASNKQLKAANRALRNMQA